MRNHAALATLLSAVILVNGQYFDWNQFNHNMQAMQNRLQQNLGNMQTKINNQVQKELAEAAQRGELNVIKNGNSVVMSTGRGHQFSSWFDKNGYFHSVEELTINNHKVHTERQYNPVTNSLDQSSYTVDLNDPNAVPVWHNTTHPLPPKQNKANEEKKENKENEEKKEKKELN